MKREKLHDLDKKQTYYIYNMLSSVGAIFQYMYIDTEWHTEREILQ